jgi:hypothetical protein
MNRYSEPELYALTFRVCVASVKQAFPHIPVANIIAPPKGQFDAVLCRQIALHLMVARFGLVKHRAGAFVRRSRDSVNRALAAVDARLEEREFEEQYRIIADRAAGMFEDKLREAA